MEVGSVSRRTALRSISTVVMVAVGIVVGFRDRLFGQPDGTGYRLVQGDRCIELTPLTGEEAVDGFYRWDAAGSRYSSLGTVDLQRPQTSTLFLYEDPDGQLSLVILHGQYEEDASVARPNPAFDGGAVTFEFTGLPAEGEWIVQDDLYDEPTNYDVWETDDSPQTVSWVWIGGRNDGGVYGSLGEDFEIEIEPRFNEAADTYDEYVEELFTGRITSWQALSGDLDDPERLDLAMDEPIRIEAQSCD